MNKPVPQDSARDLPAAPVVPDVDRPAPRWPHYVLGGAIVAAVLLEVFLWRIWDNPFGDSAHNILHYTLVGLLTILGLFWLMYFAPLPLRYRRWASAAVLIPLICYAVTIRKVEFTGDMRMIITHRWELTDEERLIAHRSQNPALAISEAEAGAEIVPIIARREDMPTYRGEGSRGKVDGPPLMQDWEKTPPPVLWKQPCGGGYAQLVVVDPYMVTIEQRGPHEALVCYDTTTGRERWVHEYPDEFMEAMGGPGPRATPTIAGGEVFSLGAKGELVKLSLVTGKLQWRRNILNDFNAPNTEWALSSSPLVVDELVIVNPGGPKGDGLVALDRGTGEPVWIRDGAKQHGQDPGDSNRCGYSTPTVVELLGTRQILLFDGIGLRGYRPENGDLLWEYRHRNGAGVNVAQPLVIGEDRIFISCSYDVGCAMVQVVREGDEWSAKGLWNNLNLRCKFTSPVLHDGAIYGLDEGIMVCIDPESGRRQWKKGRYGHGQMLLTNGQIVVHSEDGWAALVEANPKAYREITRFRTFDDPKNWNPPALVDGKLYLRNHREMACYDLCAKPRRLTEGVVID